MNNHKKPFLDIKVGILKISDRASKGLYDDFETIRQELLHKFMELGMLVVNYQVLPNEPEQICQHILSLIEKNSPQLIITTGGTGISHRDTTPEAVEKICERTIPGISEFLRLEGAKYNPYSWLSRGVAGLIKNTLILTLPGKPTAVHESLVILQTILPHLLETLKSKPHDEL